MTQVPACNLQDLGAPAQGMARNCNNERLAMILQPCAIGGIRPDGGSGNHQRRRANGN